MSAAQSKKIGAEDRIVAAERYEELHLDAVLACADVLRSALRATRSGGYFTNRQSAKLLPKPVSAFFSVRERARIVSRFTPNSSVI